MGGETASRSQEQQMAQTQLALPQDEINEREALGKIAFTLSLQTVEVVEEKKKKIPTNQTSKYHFL